MGVLICSSDNRKDILDRVLPSIGKYWPDCPYPIYAGLNSEIAEWPRAKSLVATPSGWRQESLQHLLQLHETHLIVILDDFLFQKPANQARIAALVAHAVDSNLPYLRLLPLGRSLLERIGNVLPSRSAPFVRPIASRRPFYSALQIAVWHKAHFAAMLEHEGSIWDFEHRKPIGVEHYAITDDPPIVYRHLVEKGRWLPYARSLLQVAGLKSDLGPRPTWTPWMNLRLLLDKLRFFIIGYANH